MLGSDMVVCPQTKKFGKKLKIYLPEGIWRHYFSGEIFSGGRYYMVSTELGMPAVFFKD
jgi:alpha-glucosidase (family GH31 glycosyl hydrolase)